MRILILGGTAEARDLAVRLSASHEVVTSLAGRVSAPRLPVGEVRVGGFGGVDGLAGYLLEHDVAVLVDATHPFATTMSAHARSAAALAGVPLVRYARPGWAGHPDAASWHWVSDCPAAARLPLTRPFLTTGRQTLHHFVAPWRHREVLVRVVEPVDIALPQAWTVLHDRGPYDLDGELDLLRRHGVGALVTKDSGGRYTEAKLRAAAELQLPVVVIRRPEVAADTTAVSTTDAAVAAIETLSSSRTAPRRS